MRAVPKMPPSESRQGIASCRSWLPATTRSGVSSRWSMSATTALYLEAQEPLDALYTEGYLSFAFRRTLSRLHEMQLQRFGATEQNPVQSR